MLQELLSSIPRDGGSRPLCPDAVLYTARDLGVRNVSIRVETQVNDALLTYNKTSSFIAYNLPDYEENSYSPIQPDQADSGPVDPVFVDEESSGEAVASAGKLNIKLLKWASGGVKWGQICSSRGKPAIWGSH